MFLPKIIVISNSVGVMGPAQDFGIRGDNNGESESTLEHDMPVGPYLCRYQILASHGYIRHLSYGFYIAVNQICVAISRVDGALKPWSAIHLGVGNSKQQEAHGPRFAHLSDIATANMQMFPIIYAKIQP